MPKRQWSSRSVGTRFGRSIFYGLIRIGGKPLAYFSLYWVVLYYVFCRPSIRKRSDYYIHHRFPNSSWLKRYIECYNLFLQMGKILIDQAIVGTLGPEKMKFTFLGRHHAEPDLERRCRDVRRARRGYYHRMPVYLRLAESRGMDEYLATRIARSCDTRRRIHGDRSPWALAH